MFPESSNSTQKSESTQSYPQNEKAPQALCNANEATDTPNLAANLERREGPRSAKTLTSSNITLQRLAFTARAALFHSLRTLNEIANRSKYSKRKTQHQ